ncbi:hypothetical protein ACYX8G_18450 [Microbacterium saperdae]
MHETRVVEEPAPVRDNAMVALVIGILVALVTLFGYLWQAQSSGGIQWGRQIWVVSAFVVLGVPGLGLGVSSVIRSRRKLIAATGLALTCGSGLVLYLLLF